MNEQQTRDRVTAHADAVARGDMETAIGDFSEELRPQAPQIASGLPQPVTSAEVLSLDVGDAESVAVIKYSGEENEVTLRSRWQDENGRAVIVGAEPAE